MVKEVLRCSFWREKAVLFGLEIVEELLLEAEMKLEALLASVLTVPFSDNDADATSVDDVWTFVPESVSSDIVFHKLNLMTNWL